MTDPLKTKNVFLTGGGQGLGKSYMDGLLALGAKVVFGDINPTTGKATEEEFQEKYGKDRIRFIPFDVTDGAKFEEAFQTAVNHLGYIDLMVNNAGLLAENLWETMIHLNYAGVVRGTLLASEHMRKDKGGRGGRIINTSSDYGLGNHFMTPIYCGTKHAVRAFTASLAIAPDVKARGIEYGILCPGPARTDLTMKIDSEKVRYFHLVTPERLEKAVASVERVQEGFLKLVLLEEMNGATLLVDKDQMNFQKMESVNLGDTWPLSA